MGFYGEIHTQDFKGPQKHSDRMIVYMTEDYSQTWGEILSILQRVSTLILQLNLYSYNRIINYTTQVYV